MGELSIVNRPVTAREIALAFRMDPARLERLLLRHRINPACRIGRTRVYGDEQIRRAYDALQGSAAAG